MNPYFYDFHIHSCLSPCADNDMTPENIAGMAQLKGLQMLALTDHNSCGNCPAFVHACKQNGIIPIPGMELTTAEEIHMVCLFPTLADAMLFDADVRAHYMPILNRPDIFGDQLLIGDDDEVIGTEETLLLSATTLSLHEAVVLVRDRNGFPYPAHVDRETNGILAILGDFPPEENFSCAEFRDGNNIPQYTARFPALQTLRYLCSSDAHRLGDINEAEHLLHIDDEPYSGARVTENLFRLLQNGKNGCFPDLS